MIQLERPPIDERKSWADWFFKVWLILTEKQSFVSLLGSKIGVDMNVTNTIFEVPSGKKAYIYSVLIKNPSGTLGTNYDFTNWQQTVDLSTLNVSTEYLMLDSDNNVYNEVVGNFDLTVNTGSAQTADIQVFGVLV